jgi:hypothetical protein
MRKKILTLIISTTLSVMLFLILSIYNVNLKNLNIFINYKVTPLSELKQNSNLDKSSEEIVEVIISEDMLVADLQNMNISLFKSGKLLKNFKIVSKGRPGSYYETPAGNYEIKGKFGNKFSNLGGVYMPYAMQFYGNFFIHGIPYHKNGTKVSTSYSGGCIRIADSDAKEIYDFSNTGTRLIILNNSAILEKESLSKEQSARMLTVLTSLEVLNQEKYINFNNKKIQIKELNKYVIGDSTLQPQSVKIIESQIGENNFLDKKIERLDSIGLDDLEFNVESDRITFLNYIKNNKSYILTLLN